jgi:DNA-binding NtrC family response regulator
MVITDMTMPEMTGFELSKQIFKQNPDMPIVLCTGYSELMTKEKAEAIGIKAFIMKPVLLEVLAGTIREVLDGK